LEKGGWEGFVEMHFQIDNLLRPFLSLKFAVCFVKGLDMGILCEIPIVEENRQ